MHGRPQALKEIEQKWVRATILGVVGAVLVIISAFLPWVEFYAIEITASYLGSPNESGIDGVYGKISLGLGLAARASARYCGSTCRQRANRAKKCQDKAFSPIPVNLDPYR